MFKNLTFDVIRGNEQILEDTERKWEQTDPQIRRAIELYLEKLNEALDCGVTASLHFLEGGRVEVRVYSTPEHADYNPEYPNRYVMCIFGNRK